LQYEALQGCGEDVVGEDDVGEGEGRDLVAGRARGWYSSHRRREKLQEGHRKCGIRESPLLARGRTTETAAVAPDFSG